MHNTITRDDPCHSCHLDVIQRDELSPADIAHKKRQRQERLGHQLARRRLLRHAIENSAAINNNSYATAVLSHHRPGDGDLYLTGDSSQYSNCAFLDGHEVILAANLHGDVDVLRLPRFHHGDAEGVNAAPASMTEMAGRLSLTDSDPSYSVTSKYKLKSFRNGHAFAVGTPSGRLSLFATEHASTWCSDAFPPDCKRRVRQESLLRSNNNNMNNNNRPRAWIPYITRGWEMDGLLDPPAVAEPLVHSFRSNNAMDGPTDWWLKPHGDALWGFHETSSALLAVHALHDFSGWSHQFRVMDSRSPSTVQAIDLRYHCRSGKRRQQEGITATCFATDVTIVTSVARPFGDRNVNNVIQTWDLRKLEAPFAETPVTDPGVQQESRACRKYFISYLTPSAAGNGQVMVTSASQHNHTTVQHFWYDLGRQQILGEAGSACIHQPNRNTTTFATNPTQDFMACYDTTPNGNSIRLYDLERSASGELRTACPHSTETNHKAANVSIPSKRRLGQDDLTGRNLSSNKVSRRRQDDDTCTTSSSSDSDDDSSEDEEEEPQQYPGMIPCMGQFKPKLSDRHGLSTKLSCLAVNDTGTAIVGGSFDGDIFTWRGV